MEWVYNDGGRAAAGYKGDAGDCVTRAIAIATGLPYKEVYKIINDQAKLESEKVIKKYRGQKRSSARNGVAKETYNAVLKDLGWKWVTCMRFGQGCTTHMVADELPNGTIIVALAKHLVCVKDGVIYDTYNSSEKAYIDEFGQKQINDRRCVYGYFVKEGQHA